MPIGAHRPGYETRAETYARAMEPTMLEAARHLAGRAKRGEEANRDRANRDREGAGLGGAVQGPEPEIGKPITELDMIRNATVEDGQAIVEVLLTSAGCPREGA